MPVPITQFTDPHRWVSRLKHLRGAEVLRIVDLPSVLRPELRAFIAEESLVLKIPCCLSGKPLGYVYRSLTSKAVRNESLSWVLMHFSDNGDWSGFKYGTPIFVVEGVLDEAAVSSLGLKYVVASLTNTLSYKQLAFLHTLTDKLILVFDNDRAGVQGTNRLVPALKQLGIKGVPVKYPAGLKDPGDLFEENQVSSALSMALNLALLEVLQS